MASMNWKTYVFLIFTYMICTLAVYHFIYAPILELPEHIEQSCLNEKIVQWSRENNVPMIFDNYYSLNGHVKEVSMFLNPLQIPMNSIIVRMEQVDRDKVTVHYQRILEARMIEFHETYETPAGYFISSIGDDGTVYLQRVSVFNIIIMCMLMGGFLFTIIFAVIAFWYEAHHTTRHKDKKPDNQTL